ncbi:hypothetical protein [Pikeienuella sp. HZG-20]|uniref:hypothetical protein n=1 Tax=Paludibacillus litoralis TaxID=3133267 RepID=UPI0030EF838C
MRKYLNATTITWALLHVILVLIGILVINIDYTTNALGSEISTGLGVSIMAAGVVGIFLFLYVALLDTTRSRLQALSDAGLDGIFRHRSVRIKGEYDARLAQAKRIDVVGYGLGSMLEDFSNEFARWSRQAKVRIVAINPDAPTKESSYADMRDKEEGREAGKTRSDVQRLIKSIKENEDINKDHFELRLMNSIPSVNIMIIDEEIFWGPYLLAEQSRNTFTMTVRKGGFMFKALDNHFSQIWDNHSAPPP